MKPLQNPEQELRFTRAAQAVPFWVLVAVLATASITLLACSYYRPINPELPHPLWALLPIVPCCLLARLAYRMTRHAYLILSPIGLEVFPLIRPEKGMRVICWHEIEEAEVNAAQTQLTLHFDAERSSGVHLSLRPIPGSRRDLLMHAVQERLKK